MISDKGLHCFRNGVPEDDVHHMMAYTDILSTFSSPIIVLFLGGFALGIAPLIGTPPNAIALQYLHENHSISFLDWMQLGLPFVLLQLIFAWWLLQKMLA